MINSSSPTATTALNPDRPVLRGSAQNPDVFFQAREACSPFHAAVPGIVQSVMDRFAALTGRAYRLFDYYGAPDAERVIVLMGSGAEAAEEAVDALTRQGEKVGMVKVRLYRPFDGQAFIAAIPHHVKSIAVLDRCKEPGGAGEPLYQDIVTVLAENAVTLPFATPAVVGGRYGLSSKEFTPAMVKGVFDELKKPAPKNHFTIGINDDVSMSSLAYDPAYSTEDPQTVRALFYGLGSDGTVGANKNSIKIIGSETPNYAQGYFVYDSKKSGSMTTSHLRFGPHPIRSTYLITRASFVACHNFSFIEKMNVLEAAMPGAVFLLNSPYPAAEVWDKLPRTMQQEMLRKKIEFYVIDGYKVAREAGMGTRINTIMQTCFFAISGVLPREEAIAQIKKAIQKTYGKRGEAVVAEELCRRRPALAHLEKVELPAAASSEFDLIPSISSKAPEFVRDVLGQIAAGQGDQLPVSAIPAGGAFPTGTAQWEKRNIAQFIPVWDKDLCIQCGKCVMVCPHAVIRAKVYSPELADKAPATFQWAKPKWKGMEQDRYTLQVAPEDCTGCAVCVEVCPVKSKSDASKKAINMAPQAPLRERERENWEFFLGLPEVDRSKLSHTQVKDLQLLQPLFEFSGACAGCGETPYIKLLTQLFGDRLYIANATGCSSIYGGNLPTTPYTKNAQGRGPTWANSLFEDNAEFGFGMRTALDQQKEFAELLVTRLASDIGVELVAELLHALAEDRDRNQPAARSACSRCARSSPATTPPTRATCSPLPTRWSARASGFSAATAGPSTSASAASTTCSAPAKMSTSWSSTPRSTRTPAARRPRPRRAARWPSSPPAASPTAAKISPWKPSATARSTWRRSPSAATTRTSSRPSRRPRRTRARRSSSPIPVASPTATTWSTASSSRSSPSNPATGRSCATTRRCARKARTPSSSIPKRPRSGSRNTAYREARYTMLARSNPELAAELLKEAQDDVERQWRVYSARAAMPGRGETPNIAPAENAGRETGGRGCRR